MESICKMIMISSTALLEQEMISVDDYKSIVDQVLYSLQVHESMQGTRC